MEEIALCAALGAFAGIGIATLQQEARDNGGTLIIETPEQLGRVVLTLASLLAIPFVVLFA